MVRAPAFQTPPLLIGSTGSVPAGSVSTTTRSWAVEMFVLGLEPLAVLDARTLNVTTWPGETRAGLASSVLVTATLGSTIVVLTDAFGV